MQDAQSAATMPSSELISLLKNLTGQEVPFPEAAERLHGLNPFLDGLDHGKLNELLLTLGYDRILPPFFEYLFDGESAVTSVERLRHSVDRFRRHAMLMFGNIKFAFKTLAACPATALQNRLSAFNPIPAELYESRRAPLRSIRPISAEKAYYLGYIIEREVAARLADDPDNAELLAVQAEMQALRAIGRANQDTYLTYDNIDVYIATSMRERHEFLVVNEFVRDLFSHPDISTLRLQWFDPTQAYCKDRIDKGLVEGLMVKRAKCTIYHIQENDTLGKDSELAATLAQGKPVIAYVPQLTNRDAFKREAVTSMQSVYPGRPIEEIVKDLLQRYDSTGAWMEPVVQRWVSGAEPWDIEKALDVVFDKAKAMYDKRADTLMDSHPLGLQVNLDTGVANGVLVVRSIDQCAQLLRRVMLNNLEFELKESPGGSLLLREVISKCVFRVVTADKLLTNSFWNFFFGDAERPVLSAGQRLRRAEEIET